MTTYHIRDRETGCFYSGTEFIPSSTAPKVVPKFAKKGLGKTFLDLSKIKMHINYLLGIANPPKSIEQKTREMWSFPHRSPAFEAKRREIEAWHALHPGYENVPEFLNNPYPWDAIPASWEVVVMHNRETGEHQVLDFVPSAFGEQAQRLRVLTDNFGVAVKDVFKKIEAKGKVEEFRFVAVVAPDITPDRWNDALWASLDRLKPDTARVETIIKQMGTKRADMVRSTKDYSVAVAVRSFPEAAMFKLAYDGELKVSILDMRTLSEAVEAPQ